MNQKLEVRVGQVWIPNDPRYKGRVVLVRSLETDEHGLSFVRIEVIAVARFQTGRAFGKVTRVRMDNFLRPGSRGGYRLVSETIAEWNRDSA